MKWISPGSIWRFLVAAGLALSIPLIVAAGPRMGGDGGGECAGTRHFPGRGPEMPAPPWSHLDLDDAQHDKIFAIMHEQTPEMRAKLRRLKKAEADLCRLAVAADYDAARAKALADAVAGITGEVVLLRVQTEHQVFAVLTPEQRKHAATFGPPPL